MGRETLFSYIAAFVSIVLALAMTDVIQSCHRLIRARARVRWDILPLFTAMFIYLCILSEFFSLWQNLQVHRISFPQLAWFMTPALFIALAAFACLPDEVPEEGINLTTFYYENRGYLALVLAVAFVADLVRNIMLADSPQQLEWQTILPWFAKSYWPLFVGLFLIFWAKNRWLQYLAYSLLAISIGTGIWGLSIELAP